MEDAIRNACVHAEEDVAECQECSLLEVLRCARKNYLDAESARLVDLTLNRRLQSEARGTQIAEPTG